MHVNPYNSTLTITATSAHTHSIQFSKFCHVSLYVTCISCMNTVVYLACMCLYILHLLAMHFASFILFSTLYLSCLKSCYETFYIICYELCFLFYPFTSLFSAVLLLYQFLNAAWLRISFENFLLISLYFNNFIFQIDEHVYDVII